jgi:ADP-heptose:LPS heptosyltransferase
MVQNYLDFARLLNIPITQEELVPFDIPEHDQQKVQEMLKDINKPICALSVGLRSTGRDRLWMPDRWVEVAKHLQKRFHLVFVGGSSDIQDTYAVTKQLKDITNLTGKTSVLQSAQILKQAKLTLAIDGGPMHMSAAMGTPTIALFGASSVQLWAPYNKKSVAIYHKNPGVPSHVNDTPTFYDDRGMAQQAMQAITAKEVIDTINLYK